MSGTYDHQIEAQLDRIARLADERADHERDGRELITGLPARPGTRR